jgi:hypothetical protein
MTAGERKSCGVEVDLDGAVGDGSTGDVPAGYNHPKSGGFIGVPVAEALWAHLHQCQRCRL